MKNENKTSRLYASPQDAIITLLNHYWADRFDDEHPYLLWKNYLADFTEPAKLWLDDIIRFREHPPINFVALIQENGNVFLSSEDESPEEDHVYMEWLTGLCTRMEKIYNDYLASPQYAFKQFLIRFHFEKTHFSMLEEWSEFSKKEYGQAKAIHQSLKDYLTLRDPDIVNIARKWGWIELPLEGTRPVTEIYFTWLEELVRETGDVLINAK